MSLNLTDDATAEQLVKRLAKLRLEARLVIRQKARLRAFRAEAQQLLAQAQDAEARKVVEERIAALGEQILEWKFAIIEIGNCLSPLCAAIDRSTATRQQVFAALSVGLVDRDSDAMRKYGDKTIHIIAVLDLENSATKADDIDTRPLKWCHTMAFMNAMQTNEKLAQVVHDGANDFFGGAFGEYRQTPLMERLAWRSL